MSRYQVISRKRSPKHYLPDFYVIDTAQDPPMQVGGPYLNLGEGRNMARRLEEQAEQIDVLSRAAMAPAPNRKDEAA